MGSATTTTAMGYQDSSSQQDILTSAFSRTPMTTQLLTQKDMLSSSFSRTPELRSTTAVPVTSQTEVIASSHSIPSFDFTTATASSLTINSLPTLPKVSMPIKTTNPPQRMEGTLDLARVPAYLDSVTAKDVSDWITCRAPIPEAIGMPFRRLQSRLGLFNPDKLVTPDELEKALNRLSVVAYSLQDLKDAIEALNNHYDSGTNGSRGIQVKHLVQALLTNPSYVLPGNPEMQARVQNIGASLTHQACKILTSALEAPGGRLA